MRPDADFLNKKKVCDERPTPRIPNFSAFDNGPSLIDSNRPAQWGGQFTFIGDTCYKAAIGPYYYLDRADGRPDYYSVDVEARQIEPGADGQKHESSVVLFHRELAISEMPGGFEKILIRDAVRYDDRTRLVHFIIGSHTYDYQLPSP
jgi:hypothetical protein